MTTVQEAKAAEVEAIRGRFEKATASVFVDFRGISVELITDLRNRFREAGLEYKVVKNTLVRKALEGTELAPDGLFEFLKGPTAVAWSYEEPSAGAKVIKAFRKEGDEQEKLTVKCGVFDQKLLDASRVETELAALPGKDEIRAMLLAQLQAPAQNLARQLAAPGQNLAYALDAYVKKENAA